MFASYLSVGQPAIKSTYVGPLKSVATVGQFRREAALEQLFQSAQNMDRVFGVSMWAAGELVAQCSFQLEIG